jgi:WD40 repeat protein
MDCSIKLWSIDSGASICTLIGHKAGVNCIEFGGDQTEQLYSGGDDF